jgi:hypothetical protein
VRERERAKERERERERASEREKYRREREADKPGTPLKKKCGGYAGYAETFFGSRQKASVFCFLFAAFVLRY